MTDAKANSEIATESIFSPVSPITMRKAACAEEGESGTPLMRMATAVTVQTKMVSQNTSKIPQKPCSTGLLASLHACAIDALPNPASWVNIPREIPTRIAVKNPAAAPTVPLGENACANIS